jgi:hypothetical protein
VTRLAAGWLLLALACANAPLLGQSQATTGVIDGSLRNEAGEYLADARVSLTNLDTGFEKIVFSDADGRFRALLMPTGDYRAIVELDGYAPTARTGFHLSVGRTVTIDLVLQLAAVADEIVVRGASAIVEVGRVENSVQIARATLEGLPTNGRDFLDFAQLAPGVSIVQGPDGDEITISGQKGIQNNVSVDGADFNNPFFGEQRGGQRAAFTFNLDAVEELVVVGDGAPAEFGHSSGGFINVVTKSGTNRYQGTAHLFFQDDALSAEAERQDGSREPRYDFFKLQAGFTSGGPIADTGSFWFAALDVQDYSSTRQLDPERIEPRVVESLAALGSPDENAPIERGEDAVAALAKWDWYATDATLVTLRGTYTESRQPNGTFDVDSWGTSANAIEDGDSWSVSGTLISNLSADRLNELRFQRAVENRPRTYEGPINPATGRPFPDTAFDFEREYRFGLPFFIPVEYQDRRTQLNDNFSWLTREHTFKAGVEWNETAAEQTFVGFANGRYIFGSTDGFLAWVDNPNHVECSDGTSSADGRCPAGSDPVGPVLLYLQQAGVGGLSVAEAGTQTIRVREPSVYLQDTWQPRPGLTLQLGLRWDGADNPPLITPVDELFYADFIGRTENGIEFPGDGTIPDQMDMWQPRLGISWDPVGRGQTVVRASAGRYYARVPGLMLASSRSTDGSRGQTLTRSSDDPGGGAVPAWGELIPASEIGDPLFPDVFVVDKRFENPHTDAYALAVEHEVMPGLALLARYNRAEGDDLTRMLDLNDPLLGSPWSRGLGADGANGIGVLNTVSSTARSTYDAVTLGFNKRYSMRFAAQAHYTWSRDRSDDDNERDPFTLRYAKITDLEAEFGDSDRDQPHRFNAWVLYTAPWDLQINARYSYRSGQPASITATGDTADSPQDRINPDGSVTRRNLGRKPNRFSELSLRLSKAIDLGGTELELIVEGFNLLNSRNLRVPETGNLVFNFDGTVQSGLGDPRQWQFGARWMF